MQILAKTLSPLFLAILVPHGLVEAQGEAVGPQGEKLSVSGTSFSIMSPDTSVQEGVVQIRMGFAENSTNVAGAIVGRTDLATFLTDHDITTHRGILCTKDDEFTSDLVPMKSDNCLFSFTQEVHVVPDRKATKANPSACHSTGIFAGLKGTIKVSGNITDPTAFECAGRVARNDVVFQGVLHR